MQDCSRYDEMLSALVDGELNEAETQELDAHLATCADCRKYLRLLQTMHEELGQALPDPPENLRRGILYKAGLEKQRRRFGAVGRWTVSAAVFCIALLGVVKLTGNDLESMRTVAGDTAKSVAGTMAGAAAEGFDYIRENDSAADESYAADGVMTYSIAAPGAGAPTEQADMTVKGAVFGSTANQAAAASESEPDGEEAAEDDPHMIMTPEAEVSSIYDAKNLRGYEAGMEAVNGATAYSSVGILYDMPEGLPGRKWKEQPAPIGQRRWLVSKDIMDELSADNVFDELYFGDLLADSGLIIELMEED